MFFNAPICVCVGFFFFWVYVHLICFALEYMDIKDL